MNQRTITSLIAFLVRIVFYHSTSCNAFVLGVQASRSPKMPSKTILFAHNSPAITTSSFLQIPDNSPAITTSSFLQLTNDSPANQHLVPNDSPTKQHPVPNDSPAKQHPVPNDSPTKQCPVPHLKQTFVPMTIVSTGLLAYDDHHSSLNDFTAPQAFSAMSVIKTVTMTQVPVITTAITKAIQKKLGVCILHPTNMTANNATLKKSFASCPNQLSNYDDTKCTESFAASHPRQLRNYDSNKCQLLTSVDC